MKNTMKKFVGVIMILVIMMSFGCTAFAVYDGEEETIDYEFVACLAALGMKPDVKLDNSGMVWSRTCTLADLAKTAEDLDGECDFAGEGMAYMWYSMEDNIGTMTLVGTFTYYWADDEEAEYTYYQAVFECDECGESLQALLFFFRKEVKIQNGSRKHYYHCCAGHWMVYCRYYSREKHS